MLQILLKYYDQVKTYKDLINTVDFSHDHCISIKFAACIHDKINNTSLNFGIHS